MQPIFSPTRTMSLLEQMATFTQRRQDILAGNIANVSTPGYKTRDLPVDSFQAAIQKAISQQSPKNSSLADQLYPQLKKPVSLEEIFQPELFQPQERKPDNFTFQDAGNRNIEQEVMEMSKNSLLQASAIELLVAQMKARVPL